MPQEIVNKIDVNLKLSNEKNAQSFSFRKTQTIFTSKSTSIQET